MSTFDWSILGLSVLGGVTGVALSSLALQAEPKTNRLGDCIHDLFVSRRIVALKYYRTAFSSSSRQSFKPLTDTSLEEVGNVTVEEEDQLVSTEKFTAKNHVIVFKSGFAVKPSPIQLLDESTNPLILSSENPIEFYSDALFLKGQNISPFSPSFIVTGLKGETGDKGQPGEVGDQGIKGLKGSKGLVGLKGIIGNQGSTGDVGLDGKDGLKGVKGETGLSGITGLRGNLFDFVKIWPDQLSKDADEAKDPRPSDFPGAGEYGIVSDDGKVYLSDGLNLTEVDDISEQGLRGEDGLKGQKGEKGQQGEKGLQPAASGEKGDVGLKGFVGLDSVVKGSKGDASVVIGGDGDSGDRGEVGFDGVQGAKGMFSLDGLDSLIRPEITSDPATTPIEFNGVIRSGNDYTILVYNPIYRTPVRVYGLGSESNVAPSAADIVENGNLVAIPVDSDGRGNGLVTISQPFVWFTWLDNDLDPQDVRGPFNSTFQISVATNQSALIDFDLFIDGQYVETKSFGQGTVTFTNQLYFGQSYEVKQTNPNGDWICFINQNSPDSPTGTIQDDVLIQFDAFEAAIIPYRFDSNVSGTFTMTIAQLDALGATVLVSLENVTLTSPGVVTGNFTNKIAASFRTVYSLSDPSCQLLGTGANEFVAQPSGNPLFDVQCRNYFVTVQLIAPGTSALFQLQVNGGPLSGSYLITGSGQIPIPLKNGDTYLVVPSDSSCQSNNASGVIQGSNVTAHFDCSDVSFRVIFNGTDPQTFSLALPGRAIEIQQFPTSPGLFLAKATPGETYTIASVNNNICGPPISGVTPNVPQVTVEFTNCPEVSGFRLGGRVFDVPFDVTSMSLSVNSVIVENIAPSGPKNFNYEFKRRILPNEFYEITFSASSGGAVTSNHFSGYLIADQLNANLRPSGSPTPPSMITQQMYEDFTGVPAPSIPGDNIYPKLYYSTFGLTDTVRHYCLEGPDGPNRIGSGLTFVTSTGQPIYPLNTPPDPFEQPWYLFETTGTYSFLSVFVDSNGIESAGNLITLNVQ